MHYRKAGTWQRNATTDSRTWFSSMGPPHTLSYSFTSACMRAPCLCTHKTRARQPDPGRSNREEHARGAFAYHSSTILRHPWRHRRCKAVRLGLSLALSQGSSPTQQIKQQNALVHARRTTHMVPCTNAGYQGLYRRTKP
jgi:hypothetical protein